MEQIMQPCQEKHLDEKINDVVHPVESRDFYRLEPIFCVLVGLKVPVIKWNKYFLNTFFAHLKIRSLMVNHIFYNFYLAIETGKVDEVMQL